MMSRAVEIHFNSGLVQRALPVGASAVLLGVGIGWYTTVVAPLMAVLLTMLGLAFSRWRSEVFALASIPLLLWAGLAWPIPALLAVVGLALIGGRRVEWPRVNVAQITAAAAVGFLAALAVLPLTLSTLSGSPLALAVRRPPGWLIVAAVIAIAALNAIGEETLWRGLIFDLQIRSEQTHVLLVGVQALSFGLAHFQGLPGGPLGVVAAVGYGAIMTVVRLRTGLSGAIIAHTITDTAIFGVAAHTAIYLPPV